MSDIVPCMQPADNRDIKVNIYNYVRGKESGRN